MEINKKNGVLTYLQIAFNLSPLWLRRTVETNYRLNGRYFQVITRWAFPRADLHQQGRPPFTVRLRLSRPPHPPSLLSPLSVSLSYSFSPSLPPHLLITPRCQLVQQRNELNREPALFPPFRLQQ